MLKLNSSSPLRSTSGHIRRALGSSVGLWYSFVKRHHSNISARVWRGQISHRLYELGEKVLRKHVTKALQMWHPCETFRCCTQKTQSTTANPSFFFFSPFLLLKLLFHLHFHCHSVSTWIKCSPTDSLTFLNQEKQGWK